MQELNFESGLKEYSLNGACTVKFNPTDSAFAKRLYAAFERMDKKWDTYRAEIKKLKEPAEVFEFAAERDKELRGIIDEVLGAPVCEAVFGTMNVYALADGLPVWVNLMFAIMDEMNDSFSREQKATNPRIRKYTEKYHR